MIRFPKGYPDHTKVFPPRGVNSGGVGEMTCGLVIEELEILNILRVHFSFSRNKSFDLNHISKAYMSRFKRNPVDIADMLRKKRYITLLSKRDGKYYISDLEATFHALSEHEYISPADLADKRIRSGKLHKL